MKQQTKQLWLDSVYIALPALMLCFLIGLLLFGYSVSEDEFSITVGDTVTVYPAVKRVSPFPTVTLEPPCKEGAYVCLPNMFSIQLTR